MSIATTSQSAPRPARVRARAITVAWLVAGTLDVGTAVTYYPLTVGVSPTRILQGIASGILGPQAFQGGAATAALGLALHYGIALGWTLVFYAASRLVPALTRRPLIVGPAYGVVVWAVMNLVVLPLSRVAHRPLQLRPSIIAAVILMICIGLPIATIISRSDRRS